MSQPTDGLLDSSSHVRRPEVSIRTLNQPPLLPSKQQKYFYTTPDATINERIGEEGSAVGPLEHLHAAENTSEFSYAEANRLGTQSGYLNTPHMVQRGLVPLVLPSAKEAAYGNEPFALPFPHLRKGDIAFYLRLENDWNLVDIRSPLLIGNSRGHVPPLSLVCRDWEEAVRKRKRQKMQPDEIGRSLMMSEGSQVLVNLQVVNYILHGIQHYGDSEPNWRDTFWRGFGLHRLDAAVQNDAEQLCTHVVRHCMGPFGVVASETNQRSDQAVAIVVDGRSERVRNYWAFLRGADGDRMHDDLVDALNERVGAAHKSRKVGGTSAPGGADELAMPQAGDELILVLEKVEMRLGDSFASGTDKDDQAFMAEYEKWTYVLPNRNDPAGVKMVFPLKRSARRVIQPVERKHYIWQLVPSVSSAGNASCWERRGFWSLGIVR